MQYTRAHHQVFIDLLKSERFLDSRVKRGVLLGRRELGKRFRQAPPRLLVPHAAEGLVHSEQEVCELRGAVKLDVGLGAEQIASLDSATSSLELAQLGRKNLGRKLAWNITQNKYVCSAAAAWIPRCKK